MKYSVYTFVLLLSLLAGVFYNIDNSLLRVVLIFFFCILPAACVFNTEVKIPSIYAKQLLYALIVISALIMCWLIIADNFSAKFDGPQAERFTPFLYIFYPIMLTFLYQIERKELYRDELISNKIVGSFYVIASIIIVFDMWVRFYQSPTLFLNYDMRSGAKELGIFINTNVVGMFIAFLFILSLDLSFKYKKIIQFIMLFVLVTTMARSAIIATVIVFSLRFLMQRVVTKRDLLLKIGACFFCLAVIVFFVVDPLHLRGDGSLHSKINFFESTYYIFEHSSLINHAFGYGNSYQKIVQTLNVGNWSPHIAILKAYLYYGLVGVAVYLFILFQLYSADRRMKYPMLTYLIFSLAGAPIFWPTLVVGVILLKLNRYQVNNTNAY